MLTRQIIEEKYLSKSGVVRYKQILKDFPELDKRQVYLIWKNINPEPGNGLCLYCGADVDKFHPTKGFNKYCSKACREADKDNLRQRIEQTNLRKYGTKWGCQSEAVKQKAVQTFLTKYGVSNPMLDASIKQKVSSKIQIAFKEKNSMETRAKNNMSKYGVAHPMKLERVKRKKDFTCVEKYGARNPMRVKEIRNKQKISWNTKGAIKYTQTCLKRYGTSNPMKSNTIKQKRVKLTLEKYGVPFVSQSHILNFQDLNEQYWRANFIEEGKFLLDAAKQYHNLEYTAVRAYRKMFNILEPAKTRFGGPELEISSLIHNWLNNVVQILTHNTDYGRELDIFIPSKRLAIEYNGLLWHSFGTTFPNNIHTHAERRYHLRDKLDYFESRGVHLLNIFENEWLDPRTRSIWESVIRYKLGLVQKRFYARECQVIRVTDSKFVQEFMNQNHLQGAGGGYPSLVYGLEHNNEIVALMTFGPSRFDRTAEWELLRFCTAKNTAVVGGAQKLFKYFLKDKKPASVISYANRRWSNGRVYEILGFTRTHISAPNYFWFNPKNIRANLESRNRFQKHKLRTLFPEFWDISKSEAQIMYEAGYRRVYDCGNIVFKFQN